MEELARRLQGAGDPFGRFLQAAVVVALANGPGTGRAAGAALAQAGAQPREVGLPGGRLEPGEGAWEAALRELEEELGIRRSGRACWGGCRCSSGRGES